jgi:hypothetical protein
MSGNTTSKTTSGKPNYVTCPECGDDFPLRFNFCPRCMVPIHFDPDQSEAIYEIDDPPSVDCYILRPDSPIVYVLAQPDITGRRLFLMSGNDLLRIRDEEGEFFRVYTPEDRYGFVLKSYGLRVKVATADVEEPEALGYFRVNEQLIGWKKPTLPFQIKNAPIMVEPSFDSEEIAQIKSNVVLPVVGETFGWFMVQLPSFFRGWVPEAYGYRMLRPTSFSAVTEPLSAADVLAGIAGMVGVITLVGIGAALESLED